MRKTEVYVEETSEVLGKMESGQEDLFSRLPEELIPGIIDKVADLKSLLRVLLVSKQFGSLVPHVQTVHASLSHPSEPKELESLQIFRKLESIYLEYTISRHETVVPMWKAEFSPYVDRIERLVTLSLGEDHKHTANEPREEEENQPNDIFWSRFCGVVQIYKCLRYWMNVVSMVGKSHTANETQKKPENKSNDAIWSRFGGVVQINKCLRNWMDVVRMLGKSHASLKKLTVADSGKGGKVVIGNEQLVRIRSGESDPVKVYHYTRGTGEIPVVHLPVSRYAMKDVFACLRYQKKSDSSVLDVIKSWEFEDNEKMLGEAIREICKKHIRKLCIVTL